MIRLSEKRCFLFDLDGTLYRGKNIIQGADTTIDMLKKSGMAVRFLSNNSNQTIEEIASKLNGMGIAAAPNEIYTPLRVSGEYLSEKFGISRVYVVGSLELSTQILNYGHIIDSNNPDIVFVGRDLDFTFEKLEQAGRFLQAGAAFVVTNCDLHHPGENGYNVPETGSLAAAVACMSNTVPRYIGKPEPYMFNYLCKKEHFDQSELVMVGDNPNTDIAGGIAAKIDTILITDDDITNINIKPTVRLKSILELHQGLICGWI